MQCNGVVESEARDTFQKIRNRIVGEVPMEVAHDIGEHQGSIADHGFGEDSRQHGHYVIGTHSDAGERAIDDDENGSDGFGEIIDLGRNILPVDLVLPSFNERRSV